MKEFIDKLIERLEEYKKYTRYIDGETATESCINIANELAEEYINCSTDTSTDCSTKVSEMPTGWVIDGKGIHKQTNADRIRSMTNEELAEYISELVRNSHEYLTSEGNWLNWLQSETE